MKVLILSCDTGCGHNSAAAAIADELARRGIEHHVFDPLTLGGKHTDRIVSSSYTGMLRKAPSAFGAIYRAGDLYSSTGITSPIYLANAMYAKRLNAYIMGGCYDRVICTHLFAMEAMTAIKRRLGGSVPCYGVMTDYTAILSRTRICERSMSKRAYLATAYGAREFPYASALPVIPTKRRREPRSGCPQMRRLPL